MARKVPVIGPGGLWHVHAPGPAPLAPSQQSVATTARWRRVQWNRIRRIELTVFPTPPGHDGWTEGDEACVLLDFGGLTGYLCPPPERLPSTDLTFPSREH